LCIGTLGRGFREIFLCFTQMQEADSKSDLHLSDCKVVLKQYSSY
jgi:hypothetical protein